MNDVAQQLVTDALCAALKANVFGVEIYDHAIANVEGELHNGERMCESLEQHFPTMRGRIAELHDRAEVVSDALRKLRNLRDEYTANEFEWLMQAPLRQGNERDGVVE